MYMGIVESGWFLPKWLIGDHLSGWFTSITPVILITGKNFENITAVIVDDADKDDIICGSLLVKSISCSGSR